MIIHVVQKGENINSIAEGYQVDATRLIKDNGLMNPYNLVPGQTIVIEYPEISHTVQEGDTLGSIAAEYEITMMEMLRNNSYLYDRSYLIPGETLVIKYKTEESIVTHGYALPYISLDTLNKTLPYLTYLSVFNFRAGREGSVTVYGDDSTIIQLAKEYGVIPLLSITTLSSKGEPDLETAYEMLMNEETLERNINSTLEQIKLRGYMGVNMIFSYLDQENQKLYQTMLEKISRRIREEGLLFFISFNPASTDVSNIQGIDFSAFDPYIDGLLLLRFVWGTLETAPGPVNSNEFLTEYLNYITAYFPNNKLEIGVPIFGYEWALPYREGRTKANSLTSVSAISLARGADVTIQFDEELHRPYIEYTKFSNGVATQYIVWFNDARSLVSVLNIASEYQLQGITIWNIMIFYEQLWYIVNSQYRIIKLLPDEIG